MSAPLGTILWQVPLLVLLGMLASTSMNVFRPVMAGHWPNLNAEHSRQLLELAARYGFNYEEWRIPPNSAEADENVPAQVAVLPQTPLNSCSPPAANKLCNFERAVTCAGVARVGTPSSVADVQAIVRMAVANQLRVRAVGHAHSDTSIWCDEGAVILLMDGLNRVLEIDTNNMTISVEAGAMLGEVHDAVAALGLALAFNYPANRNLTLCGLMGTGAYGSSLDVVSVPADAVLSVDVVDATGALRTFEMTDSDPTFLQALRTSIGVLGVIVRYTLPLRDAFKLEMNVLTVSDRLLLEPGFSSELVPLLRNGTYSSFGWYPRAGVLIIEHGRAVPANTPGEGRAITFNPDPNFVQLFSAINQWLIANPEFGPIVEYFVAQSQSVSPNYADANGTVSTNVTGWSQHVMAGVCHAECPWFHGMLTLETGSTIALSQLPAWSAGVMDILNQTEHRLLSFPVGGIYFRFGKPTPALLGMGQANEWFIAEVTTWRPLNDGPRYDEAGYALIESLTRDTFAGRPHWGKNQDATFNATLQRFPQKYGENWSKFWRVQSELDPTGVFISPFIRSFALP